MGLFDTVIGVAGNLFGASMQNSATEGFQQANIDWQREQLQNKHQWEIEDLRKAGLNPILSAANSSSAVSAGSPQGANPELNLTKMLNEVANSALAKKETDIAEYDAETRRITANAQKLQAKVEEGKLDSAVGLNESQRYLNLQNAERVSHLWPMEVAYAKANVSYTNQKIINSIIEVKAKADYFKKAGDAQLMIGSAAQTQAAAAMESANAQKMMAETMERNGVPARVRDEVLAGKYNQEIEESVARTAKILSEDKNLNWQLQKDMFHNPNFSRTDGGNWFTETVYGLGEYLGQLNPLKGMFK